MSKSNQDLLASFKKANKERRKRMVERAGFSTVEEYTNHLIGGNVSKKPVKKTSKLGKSTVHVVNILDRSGSMEGSKFTNAVKGIKNELVKFEESHDVNYKFSLVVFDHNVDTVYFNVPSSGVKPRELYTGGTTALFQAIGETLDKLKGITEDQQILVNIFTDGGENASYGVYKNSGVVQELIKECEGLGMTITFIGTAQDVKIVNQRLSINLSNTLVHNNTGKGVEDAFLSKMRSTVSYSAKVAKGASKEELLTGFYKETGTL